MRPKLSTERQKEESAREPWLAYLSHDLWKRPVIPSEKNYLAILADFRDKGIPESFAVQLQVEWEQYHQQMNSLKTVPKEKLESLIVECLQKQKDCLHEHVEELMSGAWSFANNRWNFNKGVYSCKDCLYVAHEPLGEYKNRPIPPVPSLSKIIY